MDRTWLAATTALALACGDDLPAPADASLPVRTPRRWSCACASAEDGNIDLCPSGDDCCSVDDPGDNVAGSFGRPIGVYDVACFCQPATEAEAAEYPQCDQPGPMVRWSCSCLCAAGDEEWPYEQQMASIDTSACADSDPAAREATHLLDPWEDCTCSCDPGDPCG